METLSVELTRIAKADRRPTAHLRLRVEANVSHNIVLLPLDTYALW